VITEAKFKEEALQLGVEEAVLKAVAEVESGGRGFINGRPVILFEPHIFWKELRKRGIDPLQHSTVQVAPGRRVPNRSTADILYMNWGERPYPSGQDARYRQLERASVISREAALASCSWGRFQIMGFNWKACGCSSLQDFVNRMWQGTEDDHLDLFTAYIQSQGLAKYLQKKAWDNFARLYNGPLYQRNDYAGKLQRAYNRFSKYFFHTCCLVFPLHFYAGVFVV
jgi:hypothetical protein